MLNRRSDFQADLLSWYRRNKRDLPWRNTADPYAIWVSEIMLQQTQVKTVIPYYLRFMQCFPSIQHLAEANLEEVLKIWEGLGYYSRARNLLAAAKLLVDNGSGNLPETQKELKRLPGIGDYTAAAVLSIAFNIAVPAVDGNIRRVFSRLMKVAAPINNAASHSVFKKLASELLYKPDPGSYNQALMELGALICTPKNPDCGSCPVTAHCISFQTDSVHEYPVVKPKPKVPTYRIAVGVVIRKGRMLITRRAEKGLLGGLWEFPGGKLEEGEAPAAACLREIAEETGLTVKVLSHLASVNHAYSHFKIKMAVFICQHVSGEVNLSGPVDFRWITVDQFDAFSFPKANHKFIPLLKEVLQGDCVPGIP